jgi:hypothetical protein
MELFSLGVEVTDFMTQILVSTRRFGGDRLSALTALRKSLKWVGP